MTSLAEWLSGRSARERGLLAFLAGVVGPAVLVVWLFLPLTQAREAAQQARDEAVALNAWVAARAGEAQALDAARAAASPTAQTDASDPAVPGPLPLSALETRLRGAGLWADVTRLAAREGPGADQGGVTLTFGGVEFIALMEWIEATEPGWGYRLEALSLSAAPEPARVNAALTLGLPEPQGGDAD